VCSESPSVSDMQSLIQFSACEIPC
jgi:hypothetical protein